MLNQLEAINKRIIYADSKYADYLSAARRELEVAIISIGLDMETGRAKYRQLYAEKDAAEARREEEDMGYFDSNIDPRGIRLD